MSSELSTFFEERYEEVIAYLDLLQGIESAARSGPPKIAGSEFKITASQQKILYSSVYLQLYNLVEATFSRCVDAITDAATSNEQWGPGDLNDKLRREWVRFTAKTHTELNPDHRLNNAVAMCEHIMNRLPMDKFRIDVGGGGNWDDETIYNISSRIGCQLEITPETRASIKRTIRDDLGPLKLVKNRRNSLAHGTISFNDCGEGVTVADLRLISSAVVTYLREVIHCFSSHIDLFDFLLPECKPTGIS